MVGGVKSRLESNPKPTRHLEGSNKTLSAPGPRDPTRDWGRSAFECLSVSWGMGQLWPAMGTGALATADLGGVVCGISPFEGGSHCHHYPIKEETQPHPLTENWIKDYWTLPIKARPRFPHSQSLPSGASGTFYPYLSEDRQNENHNHRKLPKLITWITSLSNSMKQCAMPCRATQDGRVTVELWWNAVHWRREWQTTSVFLPCESMDSIKRQKDMILKDC